MWQLYHAYFQSKTYTKILLIKYKWRKIYIREYTVLYVVLCYQWRSLEFLSLGPFPDNFFLRMGNIGQFKIYWAIFFKCRFPSQNRCFSKRNCYFQVRGEHNRFLYYLTNIYIAWIKDFNIIAVTPNSWLVSSEHFHWHIEWVFYLLSCKCLVITAVIKVFSLSYYSWLHSIRFYALRNLDVDKYAFMPFIRKL
jgi:hypothetical protein